MSRPGNDGTLAADTAGRLAVELADLRLAACNALDLPLHTATDDLVDALNNLEPPR